MLPYKYAVATLICKFSLINNKIAFKNFFMISVVIMAKLLPPLIPLPIQLLEVELPTLVCQLWA